jgi:hypothetical protein
MEAYAAVMPDRTRAARVEDVHRLAMKMPQVTVTGGTKDNPIYQVGGKSFIFFRNARPDAIDPDSGERFALGHGPVPRRVEKIGKLLNTVNQPGARPRPRGVRIHRNEPNRRG